MNEPPTAASPAPRAGRAPARILKALFLALLFLLAAEQAVRMTVREPQERMFQDDPVRFWSLRPGDLPDPGTGQPAHVNSLGMRGPEPRGEDQRRVLLLGDSRVFGMFLLDPDALDRALEPLLSRATGLEVGVYNGGVPGYSSAQALEVLRDVGPRLRPDVVVFFDCLGDVAHATQTDSARLGPRPLRTVRRALWNGSAAYRALTRWRRGEKMQGALFDQGNVLRVPREEVAANVREMDRLSRSFGARHTLIVLWPDQDSRQFGPGSFGKRNTEHSQAVLDAGARTTRTVDLWDRWARERRPVDRLFFETRVHLKPEGIRIVASQVAEELVPWLSEGGASRP